MKNWNFENSYLTLPTIFYTKVNPTPVKSPESVIFNTSLAESLGLNAEALQNKEGAAVFAGNIIPEGAVPLAQAYAGHQFGYFTMLGDGRAILIGEQITPTGERFDIQLKGSGRTPYSRGGDGRAVLGPMLREYIISEAMNALGIPTTRSLAVVLTGEQVVRETVLPGAVLTRVASSHIRVGTFQYAAEWGKPEELRALADYTINRHFKDISDDKDQYISLLQKVIDRQAELISKWQLVGFIHGVMNTDNMTISGETIDYGPCAFMDTYNPATVFSSIDAKGRYAYGNQPVIAQWNLARLSEAMLPLLRNNPDEAVKIAQDKISGFTDLYNKYWLKGMRAKLGLFNEEEIDESLVNELLDIMERNQGDFTNTFRLLTMNIPEETDLFKTQEFKNWYQKWQTRRSKQQESEIQSIELMKRSNPAVIPRNHKVEEALEAAVKGDYSVLNKLLEVLKKPFDYDINQTEYCNSPEPSPRPYRTFCGT